MANHSFDLDFKSEGVTIRDPKTNDTSHFVLQEFNGAARDAHMTQVAARVKTVAGEDSVTDFTGMQAALVSRCMFPATVTTEGENSTYTVVKDAEAVSSEYVQALPSSVSTALFEICNRICGMDDAAEDDAKKK